jgi:hypothetical protein
MLTDAPPPSVPDPSKPEPCADAVQQLAEPLPLTVAVFVDKNGNFLYKAVRDHRVGHMQAKVIELFIDCCDTTRTAASRWLRTSCAHDLFPQQKWLEKSGM